MNRKRLLMMMGITKWYTHIVTIQPDGVSGLDAQVRSTTPDSNFGAGTDINIGGIVNWRTFIKFDLSEIPDNAKILSAKLQLYATVDSCTVTPIYSVYRLKVPFVEAQVTWNSRATGTAWATAGGFGSDDCEQTAIGSRQMTATETMNEFKDFVLTPTTKAGLDLGNGWLLRSDIESADGYTFAASDNVTAEIRPKLVLEYQSTNP